MPIATNIWISRRVIEGSKDIFGRTNMDGFVAFNRPFGDTRIESLDQK